MLVCIWFGQCQNFTHAVGSLAVNKMVEWTAGEILDFWSGGRWFEPDLCCHVVSLDKKLYSTLSLSLFTRVYKWVRANIMLWVTLQWTSIPSRGNSNSCSCFILQKPELRASLLDHLACKQILPSPFCTVVFINTIYLAGWAVTEIPETRSQESCQKPCPCRLKNVGKRHSTHVESTAHWGKFVYFKFSLFCEFCRTLLCLCLRQ